MSWGWKITVFLGAFITFIVSMVVQSFSYTIDLVSEDYYMQELAYQDRIDAKERAKELQSTIEVKVVSDAVTVFFPVSFNDVTENGFIKFYRPENSGLDKSVPLKLDGNNQIIPVSILEPGYYDVFIDFKVNKEAFHIKKSISL